VHNSAATLASRASIGRMRIISMLGSPSKGSREASKRLIINGVVRPPQAP
jgi:hypothetical protein